MSTQETTLLQQLAEDMKLIKSQMNAMVQFQSELPNQRFFTITETAELLNCGRGHVYNLIKDNFQPLPSTVIGSQTKIARADLIKYLADRTNK